MAEKLTQKDYELINSYLDQELDRKDVIKFAQRMSAEPEISEEVSDLMKVKAMVKEIPTVTPPRNYILTRAMAEEARPKPWWERLFPVFRTAAAFCALALAFTFLFPLFRQQQSNQALLQNSAYEEADRSRAYDAYEESDSAMAYDAYEEAAESMIYDDYEQPVQKSVSLYDQEIVLEERNFSGAAEESYHAVMPSYGVMGGNPRIEYMMRMEESQNALRSAPQQDCGAVPEGYISTEEASQMVRSASLKIILGGGLAASICALILLRRRRKKLEVS